jgi:conjugal transfer/entry exclusion protein
VPWPQRSQAQVAVIDAANLVQNVLTAIYSILSVANQILELTPIDEIVLSGEFSGALGALGEIVSAAQGLSYDVSSLNAQVTRLFSLESAPASATELQLRLQEIRQVTFQSYWYAMQVQTLLRTLLSTVQHIQQLVSLVSSYVGNMSGNQNMSQIEGKVTQVLSELEAQTTTYNRAQSVDRIAEPLTIESIKRINEAILADHPR